MAQIFSRSSNRTPTLLMLGTLAGAFVTIFAVYWWASPYNTDVGYKPVQPVAYSHALHAGTLKIDCRYCHIYAERSSFAGVPTTQTCMNCHAHVKKDSPALPLVRASWADGKGTTPIPWKRIHKLPDYAYFNHSAHLGVGVGDNRAGIGCESCHGRIDTMEVVRQVEPLSMSWCIECHVDPAPHLRPLEALTTMGWKQSLPWAEKAKVIAATLHPPGALSSAQKQLADGSYATFATAGCNGCHR